MKDFIERYNNDHKSVEMGASIYHKSCRS